MTIWRRVLYFFCSTCKPNRSRTVRYAFPVVLSAIAILSALTIATDNKTYIEVIASDNTVRAGESISLDVFVNAHTPVNAIDISINIPKAELKVKGIDTGESVITLWTEDPYVEGDTVVLRGGTFRRGFVGRHLIATINAEAVNSGVAYVNINGSQLLAGDGSATEVPIAQTDKDDITLYIAREDGSFEAQTFGEGSTLEGSVDIRIVTDIDGDGFVTLADISRFMAAWRSRSVIYDFSGDGKMTFRDFAIILADSFLK